MGLCLASRPTFEVRHWDNDTAEWVPQYAGDPAGRCNITVLLSGYRFRYSAHAKGIYAPHLAQSILPNWTFVDMGYRYREVVYG